ncbi:MAG TPA: DUF1203 domain-containing protein [Candidatus Sulfotelmatobacter sp.]|nr:DUF1203 domain-containing protein [Candidatus Sulfotelmatobacter sp.]
MIPIRVAAIPTGLAEKVRETMQDPHYGFPAYRGKASGDAPCRHCLCMIAAGEEQILFTHDAFEGVETLPLPGPVYVHAKDCERYPEDGGFPAMLRESPRTLNAYARGRKLVAQEYAQGEEIERAIARLFARTDVDYIHVRSTTAGCYTFRIERAVAPAREARA